MRREDQDVGVFFPPEMLILPSVWCGAVLNLMNSIRTLSVRIRITTFVMILAIAACDGGVFVDGLVRDQKGAVVPGALVVLEHEGGWSFRASTDAVGCFAAGGITAPGRYRYTLKVEAPGYKTMTGHVPTLRSNHIVVTLAAVGSSAPSAFEQGASAVCKAK